MTNTAAAAGRLNIYWSHKYKSWVKTHSEVQCV